MEFSTHWGSEHLDDTEAQNKEPTYDSSAEEQEEQEQEQTLGHYDGETEDQEKTPEHDDGEKELSKQGSDVTLKSSESQGNNSVKGSTASLPVEDSNQNKDGSNASLKHDDGEKEIDANNEEEEELTEKNSMNDSVLDSTFQEQTAADDVTQENDSAIGETKNEEYDNNDVDGNGSIKSDIISSAVVLATDEPKGIEEETASVKSDDIISSAVVLATDEPTGIEEETASVHSGKSGQGEEGAALKLAETDEEQKAEVASNDSWDKDDDDKQSLKSVDSEEKRSIKSAGSRSISSKHSADIGNAAAVVAGGTAALVLTTNQEDADNKSISSEHKTVESSKEGTASYAGSIDNLQTEQEKQSQQSAENDEDIDKVSVETESLGDEQVTTAADNQPGIDNRSDDEDDDDQNQDDDDDHLLKDNNDGHMEEDFVYDLFDSSSDSSSDDDDEKKKKDKRDDDMEYPLYATHFDSLHFHNDVKASLFSVYGWTQPTDVQAKCLPQALKWKDCIIQAPPGSGKTMTYVLSCLNSLPRTSNRASAKSSTRVLVVCPSRELCIKLGKVFTSIAENMSNACISTLVGGMTTVEERQHLARRPNVVIGTPGRISKVLSKKQLNLSQLKTLVIEHSDLMGTTRQFKAAINQIFKKSPRKKQVILLSTTTPGLKTYTREPFEYLTENAKLISPSLNQYYVNNVGDDERQQTLCKILKEVDFKQALVFCNSAVNCSNIVDFLSENDIKAKQIHNDCRQEERRDNYEDFVQGKTSVLVTTDALSRVTANEHVDLVVNYDMPVYDVTTFVYRVTKAVPVYGKSSGIAISFLETSNIELFQQAEKEYAFSGKELPTDLKNIQMHDAPDGQREKEQEAAVPNGVVIASHDATALENNDTQRPDSGKSDTQFDSQDNDKKEIDNKSVSINASTHSHEQETDQNNRQETNSITHAASSQEPEVRDGKASSTSSRRQSANSIKQEPQVTRRMSVKSAHSSISVKSKDDAKTCVCNIL